MQIPESGDGTQVFENGTGDDYTVKLEQAPAAGEVVTVTLATSPGVTLSATTLKFGLVANVGLGILGLERTRRRSPSASPMTASSQPLPDRHHAYRDQQRWHLLQHVETARVRVDVVDSNTAGVEIIETDGSTQVSQAGQTDSYQMRLTTVPTATVRVDIDTEGKAKPVGWPRGAGWGRLLRRVRRPATGTTS